MEHIAWELLPDLQKAQLRTLRPENCPLEPEVCGDPIEEDRLKRHKRETWDSFTERIQE